jgi:hypothetical protein
MNLLYGHGHGAPPDPLNLGFGRYEVRFDHIPPPMTEDLRLAMASALR